MVDQQRWDVKDIIASADEELGTPVPDEVAAGCVRVTEAAVGEAAAVGLPAEEIG